MAGTAVRGRLTWQVATVVSVTTETGTVRTLELSVPDWAGHEAGQHLDVRLTADDGYVAERSYSIASAPGEPVAITVERLEDGEVSPYLTEDVRADDEFEIRGPIGGYFVWTGAGDGAGAHVGGAGGGDAGGGGAGGEGAGGGGAGDGARPLLLVAGGSGIVPLRSILRHRDRIGSTVPARLLYSARSLPDVIYRAELDQYGQRDGVRVTYTLTRQHPPDWTGRTGRVDAAVLAEEAWPPDADPLAFVCGPTPFVETVAAGLVKLGYPAPRVKTERFGGAGGS
jgi:ferredoxin-NADP reductase